TFEAVRDGKLTLDPTIDVVTSLGLSRETILARMPKNLRTLRRVLDSFAAEFQESLRAESGIARTRWRRRLYRLVKKARKLADELSPRTELLERWVEELIIAAAALRETVEQ